MSFICLINFNFIQTTEKERQSTLQADFMTTNRLPLLNQKDSLELIVNFAAAWAGKLQVLLNPTKKREEKHSLGTIGSWVTKLLAYVNYCWSYKTHEMQEHTSTHTTHIYIKTKESIIFGFTKKEKVRVHAQNQHVRPFQFVWCNESISIIGVSFHIGRKFLTWTFPTKKGKLD